MGKFKFNNSWSNSSFWLDDDFTTSGNSIFDDYDKILDKYKTKTNYYQEKLTW